MWCRPAGVQDLQLVSLDVEVHETDPLVWEEVVDAAHIERVGRLAPHGVGKEREAVLARTCRVSHTVHGLSSAPSGGEGAREETRVVERLGRRCTIVRPRVRTLPAHPLAGLVAQPAHLCHNTHDAPDQDSSAPSVEGARCGRDECTMCVTQPAHRRPQVGQRSAVQPLHALDVAEVGVDGVHRAQRVLRAVSILPYSVSIRVSE